MIEYKFFKSRKNPSNLDGNPIVRCNKLLPEFDRYTTRKDIIFADTIRVRRIVQNVDPSAGGVMAVLGPDLNPDIEYEVEAATLLLSVDVLTAGSIAEALRTGKCVPISDTREYVTVSEVRFDGSLLQLYADEGRGAIDRAVGFITDTMGWGQFRSAHREHVLTCSESA